MPWHRPLSGQARGPDLEAVSPRLPTTSVREVERRHRDLRRDPQHQLHQRLRLPLRASAPSPREARGRPPRPAVSRPPSTRSSAAREAARERGGRRSASRAESTPPSRRLLSLRRAGRSRPAAGPARPRFSRSRSAGGGDARGDARRLPAAARSRPRPRCPGLPPRSSTTRSARSFARQGHDAQWLDVHDAAHRAGLRSTTTIMFGTSTHRALGAPLARLARPAATSGGFTGSCPSPSCTWRRRSPCKRRRAPRSDLPRGAARPCRRPARAPPVDHEHPGVVGQARLAAHGRAPRGRQRPRRHPHERVDLARRRGRPRTGAAAGTDGGADPHPGRTPRQRTTLYGQPDSRSAARSAPRR